MITNKLNERLNNIKENNQFKVPQAVALGVRRRHKDTTLDVLYTSIQHEPNDDLSALFWDYSKTTNSHFYSLDSDSQQKLKQDLQDLPLLDHNQKESLSHLLSLNESKTGYSTIDIGIYFCFDLSEPIQSVEDAFFRLQLISQRCVKPHSISLDGLFGTLHNIAWTNKGPILVADVEKIRLSSQFTDQPLQVSHVDKFPYLADYTIPSGVRIASGSQVRLGAYLGQGTTVMPAGYVNFNAGSQGNAMIEGRVSAGVVIGNNTDVGGGASIMGTLSGGNTTVISIGDQCLLGANSGTGISLGRGCTIAAGLYIYAGMKVSLYNSDRQPIDINGNVVTDTKNTVKASELSGRDFLLFIQHSETGKVECFPNQKLIELNSELHNNM
ncbi:2,3,4,5-tetrahydropyridine-2,6-carboxylate N-succinyltransferase [Candidatus Marinamargulisbacteria bacterium SCGC AG-410-N11]|nr:2,3,4,5-tetrahydropyridine-2,6-carboxylate N-succinyltransferase [Candidatus Marinamargulisbacteria bacterium SCGC AG-410-N11]